MLARPPWTARYKSNWNDAFARMMAWWAGDGLDRPVLIPYLRKDGAPKFTPACDPGTQADRDLSEEYRLAADRYFLEWRHFHAETAPYAGTAYGSSLCTLAAMAGARVHYTPDTGTAWIQEEPDLYSRDLPEFHEDSPPYAFAVRMIRRHAETFGYDCILGADVMLDPLTTLSMMRGAGNLCMDLVERPDMVRRWADRLGEMFLRIAAGYRVARALQGRREHYNWTGIWAPGDLEALQCDFSAMLSPEMFRAFAMPHLERQAAFYDYALWHLDGPDEIRHLEDICSVPRLRAIQWVDTRRQGPKAYVDLFRKVLKLDRSVIFGVRSADEALDMARLLGKDRVAMALAFGTSPAEVETLERKLKAL